MVSTIAFLAGCAPHAATEHAATEHGATEHASSEPTTESGRGAAPWTPLEQWALGAMADALAGDDECLACHADHRGVDEQGDELLVGALVMHDWLPDVAGAPAEDLGAGAVCADCHRGAESPQAEVFLGRGSELIAGAYLGHAEAAAVTHARVADSCLACHAPSGAEADPEALTLGHTFSVREHESGALAREACAHCHGEAIPAMPAFDARLAAARDALAAERGDDAELGAMRHDLDLLAADGSHGVHNPAFARALLGAVEARVGAR